MGKLILDGLNVGAVYYELGRRKPGAVRPGRGRVTGEPHVLHRAYKEGRAVLVLRDGHRLPITVAQITKDEGTAVIRLEGGKKAQTR